MRESLEVALELEKMLDVEIGETRRMAALIAAIRLLRANLAARDFRSTSAEPTYKYRRAPCGHRILEDGICSFNCKALSTSTDTRYSEEDDR